MFRYLTYLFLLTTGLLILSMDPSALVSIVYVVT